MSNLSTNTNFEVTTISPENLAKRWDIDPSTVYKYVNTGILRRVSKIGAVRILISDVEELEDDSSGRNKSFRERKLERALSEKDKEIQVLKDAIARIQLVSIEAVYLMEKVE